MTAKVASQLIFVVALAVSIAWWTKVAPVPLVLPVDGQSNPQPQPQRPPDPPELVAARAREKQALDELEQVVREYLWSTSDAERARAERVLQDPAYANVSRKRFLDLEAILRRGRTDYPPLTPATGTIPLQEISFSVPGGPDVRCSYNCRPDTPPRKRGR